MDMGKALVGIILGALGGVLLWFLNWVYLRPRRSERHLRQQGISGSSYKLFHGDTKMIPTMIKEAISSPTTFDSDITFRVVPIIRHFVDNYGKISYMWIGPTPRIIIMDPKMVREMLLDYRTFQKRNPVAVRKLFLPGIVSLEGDEWAQRRRALNPAFHLDKLKQMFPIFRESCNEMMKKWEMLVRENGPSEIDVWQYFANLSGDIISRAAFGSNFEEGRKIFRHLRELTDIIAKRIWTVGLPGWRFFPTKTNYRIKVLNNKIKASIRGVIEKKKAALQAGEATQGDDLLGIILDAMNIEEVMEECKLFYFAGAETTYVFLTWVMIMLARHQDWQANAREEVLEVFGKKMPDFDGLSRLKVVTMIMNETLRLYPPVVELIRKVYKPTRLGELCLPAGVELTLPIMLIHYDTEIWGDDATEFNPDRFSEGVARATNHEAVFFPFSQGPRICIGQNFSLMEAKLAISMILQRFYFELSPSYVHAPYINLILQPQHGAYIILHEINL